MKLSGLLSLLDRAPSYRRLTQALGSEGRHEDAVLPEAARAYVIAALHRSLGLPLLVLTTGSARARQLSEEIPLWLGTDNDVLLLPEPDALPYERLSPDAHSVRQTLYVLSRLAGNGPAPIVVASAHAASAKLIDASTYRSACHTIEEGITIDPRKTVDMWLQLGYEMESLVDRYATISRRGGILDIFSPNNDLPARIELFGDSIESIRFFDPSTQRSIERVQKLSIVPASQVIGPPAELAGAIEGLDVSNLSGEAGSALREDISRLEAGQRVAGIEFYAPLLNDGYIGDYMPGGALVVLDEPETIETALQELDAQASELRRSQTGRGQLPSDFPVPYLSWTEMLGRLGRLSRRLSLLQWGQNGDQLGFGFAPAPVYIGRFPALADEITASTRKGQRAVVVSQQARRLSELLSEADVIAAPVEGIDSEPAAGSLTLVQGALSRGWALEGEPDTLVLTDTELFGFTKERRGVAKRAIQHADLLAELGRGDYVVHVDHGIGRFSGMIRKDVDSGWREYLILEYAAGDKLYVPTDQVDRVARYIGAGGYTPALSRLGTQEWTRTKQRVKQAANELARSLITLYSAREVAEGISFSPDSVWQRELEASFPYVETPDQLAAVQGIKADMEKSRPMDRLVCGDVGYGKTEVAIRAAFKAVMDGAQVAVLVPTTVLAQQHFRTFGERMAAFPLNIELLSRFRSPGEQRRAVEGLANGSVDICIGTHRLLQKDVSFKNLGLVIIDEEQRFGVAHKERLKALRQEVDVLTLSATPIPRTMHMALVGVRDMSNVETPPDERLPIKTMVGPYDDRVVREAVLRELERGGQVFYVHNRVNRIGRVARELQALIPEATVAVGHGQMPEESLESVMIDFAAGKVDVLVCTTIIESGLDLPNVNTLIVEDADKLGLTQLYQLRGRVGRGSNRAHAYFLYQKGKRLTDTAQKRLKTIYEATELGAGFRIAMKDLEIRGAGNLLGPEQSGHMGAVGFDLYCRLLADEVSTLKGERAVAAPVQPAAATVDLPLAAFIPEEYVSDLNTRLSLYMRLAGMTSVEDTAQFRAELCDRFGPVPPEFDDLLYMVRVKLLGTTAGVQEVYVESGQVVVKLGPWATLGRESLTRRFGPDVRVGKTQLRLDTAVLGDRWQSILEQVLEDLPAATSAR